MSWRQPFVIAAAAVAAACQPMINTEPDQPQGTSVTAEAPISTDSTRYGLARQGGGLAASIRISFQNTSDRRMYIVNCRGNLVPSLQKQVNGDWVDYWSAPRMNCLSPPIVIERGATLERDVPVWGALPSANTMPAWASAEVDGTYRMVLHMVVWNYDDTRQGFGDPVPLHLRTSNEFILQR